MTSSTDTGLAPLFTWRSVVASTDGPDQSTTRHVLLTLGLHMNEKGGSCFPATRTLAVETALSRRTVEKHLKTAVEEGWISRDVHGYSGRRWRRNEYIASLPTQIEEKLSQELAEGGESPSPPSSEGGESDRIKVGKELPTSTSYSTSVSNGGYPPPSDLKKNGSGQYTYPDSFESFWSAYPDRSGEAKKKGAYRKWRGRVRNGTSEKQLTSAARRYARFCEAEDRDGTRFVMLAQTFLGPDEPWREDWGVSESEETGPEYGRLP